MSKEIISNNIIYYLSNDGTTLEEVTILYSQNFDGNVIIPEGITKINDNVFCNCNFEIKSITLPQSLEIIGDKCFCDNLSLTSVIIPQNVKKIGESVFSNCKNLKKAIFLCNNLIELPDDAFFNCTSLKECVLNDGLTIIGNSCFEYCKNLETIVIPDSVTTIEPSAFQSCINLKDVQLSKNIKTINFFAFAFCKSLKTLKFPESLTALDTELFDNAGIEELTIPKSIKSFDLSTISIANCPKLKTINFVDVKSFLDKDKYQAINTSNIFDFFNKTEIDDMYFKSVYNNVLVKLNTINFLDENGKILNSYTGDLWLTKTQNNEIVLRTGVDENSYIYIWDKNKGETKIQFKELFAKKGQFSHIEKLDIQFYPSLIKWAEKTNKIPNYRLIEFFPTDLIDLFKKDNNAHNWQQISKLAKFETNTGYETLLKLAIICGVFSKDGKESIIATKFITEEILERYNESTVCDLFNGFNIDNRYQPEWAKFFMDNFKINQDFLEFDTQVFDNNELTTKKVNYLIQSYNNFHKIMNAYPNLFSHSRHNKEVLTPQMVVDVLTTITYENVDEKAIELSEIIKPYKYSQEGFEKLQKAFLLGLENKENQSLLVKSDSKDFAVQYELLDKSNPLGAILGPITNCCQRLNAIGEECMLYGMSQPNSGFVIFKTGEETKDIIGQAWVWYDERNQTVCLDNIEIPRKQMDFVMNHLSSEFVKCLNRFCKNTMQTMNSCGHCVKQITMGLKHNDIYKIVKDKYIMCNKPVKLTGYEYYTDAGAQQVVLLDENTLTPQNLSNQTKIKKDIETEIEM